MSNATAVLDKSLDSDLGEGFGTIAIRVVVVDKPGGGEPVGETPGAEIADLGAEETLPEVDKRPISNFLEEPKRGRQCCVFLINGQRQHAWDNSFIVRDLDLKYLRNRTIVVVECDGLKPEALAELMQGSRHQFYEGSVYSAVASRVIATLKGDPDLRELEEEAEEDIASMQAADESVKSALDQLIDAHHDQASRVEHGHSQGGESSRDEGAAGTLLQTHEVIVEGDPSIGIAGDEPVLVIRPDLATIRLRPNEPRRIAISVRPETAWGAVHTQAVTFDPPLTELQVTQKAGAAGEEVILKFAAPADFDDEELPLETTLRFTAMVSGYPDPRVLERRLVVSHGKKKGKRTPPTLKDDPTFVRVSSRQPIKLVAGGPDLHVKLRWDGSDSLIGNGPQQWTLRARCESTSIEPQTFLTRPAAGRFELLVQATPGLLAGTTLKFDVEAVGPGKTLSTAFLVDVVEPVSPRKTTQKIQGGGQRRPPYVLLYVQRKDWQELTCWGGVAWSGADAGAFQPSSAKSPLTILINQDMEILEAYRESLLAKKLVETTIKQRINRYTAHVAFHLYQMSQMSERKKDSAGADSPEPSEDQMRDEIQRVAQTLLRLMEVGQ